MAIIRTIGQTTEPQNSGEVPNGIGYAPVGSILAWVPGYFSSPNNSGYNRILGSADSVAGANSYLIPLGWRVCDGGEPSDSVSSVWNVAGRKVPQINDRRFLQGSLSIVASGEGTLNPDGTIQGASNTIPDHIHALSFTSQAESGHTHTLGGSTSAGTQHTHNWPPPATNQEGNWSTDSSNSVATSGGYGDGSQNTYSDQSSINDWSISGKSRASGYSQQSLNHSHTTGEAGSHQHLQNQSAYATGGAQIVGVSASGSGTGANGYTEYAGAHTHSVTDTNLTNHSHEFYLYAHRHWIKTRAATGESTHTHPLPTNTGATSGHTHTISGNAGTGQIPSATENRPQYLRCFMIIRFK